MIKTRNSRQSGFSLIELMIAIAISMIAMVAAVMAYSSARQTNRLQGMQTRLSEDGRFAVAMLQRVVSQAGFRPTPQTAMASERISVAANVITLKFDPDGFNQIICDGSVATGATQTLVVQRNGGKLQCATGAAAADDWITPATSGIGNGTEVIDFKVLLGLDTAPTNTPSNFGCGTAVGGVKPRDCIADTYVDALGVNTSDEIVAVKVCLMLKSEAMDMSVVKPAPVKDCAGNDIADSQTDHKLYRAFRTTVSLKNR